MNEIREALFRLNILLRIAILIPIAMFFIGAGLIHNAADDLFAIKTWRRFQ